MDIYRQIIIDLFQHPHHFGVLKKPSVTNQEFNSFCGDKLRMDLKIHNDKIIDVKFSGSGCAISIACASILTDMIYDKTIIGVEKMRREDLLSQLNINLSPTRLKCAYLSWEVLQKALYTYHRV